MHRIGSFAAAALALAALACGGDDSDGARPAAASSAGGGGATATQGGPGSVSTSELSARGERIYNVNCIACHHRDPTRDGGLGPPIVGSSRELLEARVLRAEYPPGYQPQSDTRLMVPLPHLEPELDALTAFLASRPSG